MRVSIPHQRNAGVRAARGDIIVFTDAGCQPEPGWLDRLVAPLRAGEHVAAGLTLATPGSSGLYDQSAQAARDTRYLTECATINLAFRRAAFDAVGGFDEDFAYGSDVDFSWRLVDRGYRIRNVPGAIIRHDWGGWRRQLRRSYVYGQARARLYRKHRSRLRHVLRDAPMVVAYPAFLLGLPLTLVFPLYPALLLIPGLAEPVQRRGPGAGRPPHVRGRHPVGAAPMIRMLVLPRDPNPYQGLLYGALGRLGVRVRYLGELTRSHTVNLLLLPAELAWHRMAGARVVHLHWVSATFTLPGARRFPVLRRLGQAWFLHLAAGLPGARPAAGLDRAQRAPA